MNYFNKIGEQQNIIKEYPFNETNDILFSETLQLYILILPDNGFNLYLPKKKPHELTTDEALRIRTELKLNPCTQIGYLELFLCGWVNQIFTYNYNNQ